jgi:D-threo-aldose 1-dehydrogenase
MTAAPLTDPTKRVTLGRTQATVTRLSVGTVPIAGLYQPVSDAEAQSTLQAAWDVGVRYFDTAPVYGLGLAEERLGRFLSSSSDLPVISTKVGRLLVDEPGPDAHVDSRSAPLFEGAPPRTPVFDFSYDAAHRSLEASLERLGVDRVDVVFIHDPDDFFVEALDGAFRALSELRSQGVISAVGVGMSQSAMLNRFADEADFDCFLLAGRYTLLEQPALEDLLPNCAERGISVIAGGVLNSGLLADPKPGITYEYAPADAQTLERALALEAVCKRHGVPLAAAAIQFPLGHAAIATVLLGVRTPAEMHQNEKLFQWPIPQELWDELKAESLLAEHAPVPTSA